MKNSSVAAIKKQWLIALIASSVSGLIAKTYAAWSTMDNGTQEIRTYTKNWYLGNWQLGSVMISVDGMTLFLLLLISTLLFVLLSYLFAYRKQGVLWLVFIMIMSSFGALSLLQQIVSNPNSLGEYLSVVSLAASVSFIICCWRLYKVNRYTHCCADDNEESAA